MKRLKQYQYEKYAVLCNLAYPRVFRQTQYGFDPNGQRTIANRFGKTVIRVLWSKHQQEAIIVIKGSHSLRDWIGTFAVWQRGCKPLPLPYKIHAGFFSILSQESLPSHNDDTLGLSVFEKTMQISEELIRKGKRITITGHSSGGAIGCVIADAIERRFPKSIKRVVTFGQPAVGGWRFKTFYKLHHKTYRVCCDIDIVTFLPPLPFYYWHVGKMLWLYNGRIYENTPTLERLIRSLFSWFLRPFSYHLMSKYIRNKDFFDEH